MAGNIEKLSLWECYASISRNTLTVNASNLPHISLKQLFISDSFQCCSNWLSIAWIHCKVYARLCVLQVQPQSHYSTAVNYPTPSLVSAKCERQCIFGENFARSPLPYASTWWPIQFKLNTDVCHLRARSPQLCHMICPFHEGRC